MNRVKIDARDWLWIIKLFELETRPSVIAAETGISYPTVLKALNTIRVSLAAFNAKDSRDARARGSRAAPPVLGVLKDENGSILTVPVPRDLIIVHMKIDGGRLILADRTISYAWLLVHDQRVKAVDAGKNFARCRVYCSRRGFWQYAKERLIKHHGVSHGRLMLYLNEIDFRWANRDDSIFDLLTERLCGFAPAGRSYADGARMAV